MARKDDHNIDVYVKLPSGKVLSFLMRPSEEVGAIYGRVAEDLQVAGGQVNIKYTGKILNRKATISGLGICRETILKAELISIKHLTVFIKQNGVEPLPIPIDNINNISTLQLRIKHFTEVDCHRQILKFANGQKVPGTGRLLDVGIEDGMQLTLESKSLTASAANADLEEEEIEDESLQEQILSSFDAAGKAVEVVFSFDTTGSMYSCLVEVRSKLCETVERLLRDIPNIRIGIIAHGDYCDYSNYVLRQHDLSRDVSQLTEFVNSVPSTGGGDSPECYEWVLRKAQALDWSEDSAKALVVIGDDVPHTVCYTDLNINWHQELDVLCGMGVKVYGVQKNGMYGDTKMFYQELADRSGGAYLKLANFKLITDMFLAVCYKESSSEQLEDFCAEVRGEGRMSEDAQQMFTDLQEKTAAPPTDRPAAYVAASWWDPNLSSGSPQYVYYRDTDTWKPYRNTEQPSSYVTTAEKSEVKLHSATRNQHKIKPQKHKGKCSIM